MLVDIALHALLVKQLYGVPLSNESVEQENPSDNEVSESHNDIAKRSITHLRTAELWFMYS